MAPNTKPLFTGTPKVGVAQLAAANPARDGTGAIVDLFTAGANGGRVDKIVMRAKAATTAGAVRLFYKPDGGAWSLIDEAPVTANAALASSPAFGAILDPIGGLVLPAGAKVGASTHNAEPFAVTAFGGDF
jgi:hypothetical protein